MMLSNSIMVLPDPNRLAKQNVVVGRITAQNALAVGYLRCMCYYLVWHMPLAHLTQLLLPQTDGNRPEKYRLACILVSVGSDAERRWDSRNIHRADDAGQGRTLLCKLFQYGMKIDVRLFELTTTCPMPTGCQGAVIHRLLHTDWPGEQCRFLLSCMDIHQSGAQAWAARGTVWHDAWMMLLLPLRISHCP